MAQRAFEEMDATLGMRPVHHTLANHWPRVIEMIHAAERIEQILAAPEITNPNVRRVPTHSPEVGIGVVDRVLGLALRFSGQTASP